MSILSDRQIRELCVPPAFMVTEYFPALQDPQHDTYFLPYPKEYPSHKQASELDELIAKRNGMKHRFGGDTGTPGVISYRPLTEKEIAAFKPMIAPFYAKQVREVDLPAFAPDYDTTQVKVKKRVISYGLSSYGYDVLCGNEFKVFTNLNSTVVDPKNFNPKNFVDVDASKDGYVIIPPNSFALARTVETFRIPRDVLVVCLGKSTYARCGIVVNVTPLEPEWEGQVTLEFSNTTPLPAKIYAGEGCAQMLFFRGSEPCEVSYADRGGKYQGQTGVTLPKS